MKLNTLRENLTDAQFRVRRLIVHLSPSVHSSVIHDLVWIQDFLKDIESALQSYSRIGTALKHVVGAGKKSQSKAKPTSGPEVDVIPAKVYSIADIREERKTSDE